MSQCRDDGCAQWIIAVLLLIVVVRGCPEHCDTPGCVRTEHGDSR